MLRKFLIVLSVIFCFIAIAILILRHYYNTGALQEAVLDTVINRVASIDKNATSTQENVFLLKQLLGFEQKQNYLILFLNNTELRPAGGFIGVYGVVAVQNGIPKIEKIEGTEILDNYAPQNYESIPPDPIKKYLKVERWAFRDSNWSPDFAISSQKALEFYKKENGLLAGNINTVVGITPTVMEELLKITGPITIEGEEYNSQNFTEKLEYEVEYGYKDKSIDQRDRKQILQGMTAAVVQKLRGDVFKNWGTYFALFQRMLVEKQIILYSVDVDKQKVFSSKLWSGEMNTIKGDYLLYADANLGAWKTDVVMKRELNYQIVPVSSTFHTRVTMRYTHQGEFDWRTRDYRSYARIYVPKGSKIEKVTNPTKNVPVDQGVENGRQWFGTFITIAAGKTSELVFEYSVSPEVDSVIKSGNYELVIQKQIGTIAHALTLSLDFGKKVIFANPGENPQNYGDNRFDYKTDLRTDQEFSIKTLDK
jgi:hypothetical protein